MLAARAALRSHAWRNFLQHTSHYSSSSGQMRPHRLVALAGGASLVLYTCSRVAQCRHMAKVVEKEETESHDPWLLVPRQKPLPASSPRSVALRIVALPLVILSTTITAIRMTIRCIVLWMRFVPLGMLYPLAVRSEKLEEIWWRAMLWNVQSSGPTMIKLGQWASTRRDIFSKRFCDKLSILHTKTKKKRYFRDCDKVLRSLFGSEILKEKDRIFPHVEPYSIGSGCIAQVYRLTIDIPEYERFTGEKVRGLEGAGLTQIAIKVADRNVEEKIEMDLSILRNMAAWSQWIVPSLRFLDPLGALEQFEMVLRRQVDLRNEARALQKFSENFDPAKTGIRFPVVVAFNKNAIAETFEEGMYINKLVAEEDNPELKAKQSPAVRRRIALLGARALLKMIFVDNFVHGDLHPGNILIRFNDKETLPGVHHAPPAETLAQRMKEWLRDVLHWRAEPRLTFTDSPDLNDEPTLVLLDTGIAISETPRNLRNLRAIFRCIVEKKGYRAGELLLSESPDQQCREPERFCRQVEELVVKARSERSLRTLNISALLSQLFNIVSEHKVSLDSAFTSVMLSVMVLEGFGRSLDPDLDLFQCARPYLLNVML